MPCIDHKKNYNTFNFCVQKRWRNMNSHYLVVKTNSSEFLPWQSGRLIINHKSLLHFIQNIWPRMRRNNITDYDLLSAFTTNKILNNLKTFVLMPRDCLLILNSGRLWREKGKEKNAEKHRRHIRACGSKHFLEKLVREGDIYLALESNAVKTYIW